MTEPRTHPGSSSDEPRSPAQDRPASFPRRVHGRLHAHPVTSLATKAAVGVIGGLVTAVGLVMLVTPGPAFVMIPLGLAILATEFDFARRWLDRAKEQARRAQERAAALDPRVRRRRLLLTGLGVLLVIGAVTAYVMGYGWPRFAVDSWDWVQSMAGWVPDLPGM